MDEAFDLTADKRLPKTRAARKKFIQRQVEEKKKSAAREFVPLSKVQTSILRIFGYLCLPDRVVSEFMLGNRGGGGGEQSTKGQVTRWTPNVSVPYDMEPPLMFPVPFIDIKADIAIGKATD